MSSTPFVDGGNHQGTDEQRETRSPLKHASGQEQA
jgi:hypothetical protein